jgi:hypothetical protein
MAEFAPVGMFIADSTGKITYSNDTWCKFPQMITPLALGVFVLWIGPC